VVVGEEGDGAVWGGEVSMWVSNSVTFSISISNCMLLLYVLCHYCTHIHM